jgi:hypothetical protein
MRRWSVAPTHAPTPDTAKRTAWMLATADAGEAKRKPRGACTVRPHKSKVNQCYRLHRNSHEAKRAMSLQNAAMYGRRARDSRSSEVLGDNVNRAIEQLNSAIEKLERRVRQLESKIADR